MATKLISIMSGVVIVFLSANAFATDPLTSFLNCSNIENPPKRYACYDATAAEVKSQKNGGIIAPKYEAIPKKTVPSTAKNGVNEPEAKEKLFGLFPRGPKATEESEFGIRPEVLEPESITEIESLIRDFSLAHTGEVTILLENDQIWRQLSGDATKLSNSRMKRQATATVREAAFGSYRMTLSPSQKSIRVKRIK